MDKGKLLLIFNELLDEWESAQETVNHDRGLDISGDQDRLDFEKAEYIKRFNEALNTQ